MSDQTASETPVRRSFSLNKIAGVVESYVPPAGNFSPESAYELRFGLYTILSPKRFGQEGELRIAAVPTDDGHVFVEIRVQRTGTSGYSQYIAFRTDCRRELLTVPERWTASSKLALSDDALPYLHTGLLKHGAADPGALVIECEGVRQTRSLSSPYTAKWLLIDAVQRLNGDSELPCEFTVIDEFDDARPGQRLERKSRISVSLAATEAQTVTAFQHTGAGVIPTVYWVDDQGRVLFIISGQEVYILLESNGAKAQFDATVSVEVPAHG